MERLTQIDAWLTATNTIFFFPVKRQLTQVYELGNDPNFRNDHRAKFYQ